MSNVSDKRVIVVEDNIDNYNLILRLLMTMGVEHCEWISSGWKVAAEAEQHGQIDLILLDIQLPYEDGFEVHRKLREHPILKDRLVRQAIDYALDRDELIVGARFGQAIPLHANVLPTHGERTTAAHFLEVPVGLW